MYIIIYVYLLLFSHLWGHSGDNPILAEHQLSMTKSLATSHRGNPKIHPKSTLDHQENPRMMHDTSTKSCEELHRQCNNGPLLNLELRILNFELRIRKKENVMASGDTQCCSKLPPRNRGTLLPTLDSHG